MYHSLRGAKIREWGKKEQTVESFFKKNSGIEVFKKAPENEAAVTTNGKNIHL